MLAKIGDAGQFLVLLAHIPKGLFFLKDAESRTLEWTVTSKFPVRDRQGKVIGVIGMVGNSPQTMPTVLQDPCLLRAMEYIQQRQRLEDVDGARKPTNGPCPILAPSTRQK